MCVPFPLPGKIGASTNQGKRLNTKKKRIQAWGAGRHLKGHPTSLYGHMWESDPCRQPVINIQTNDFEMRCQLGALLAHTRRSGWARARPTSVGQGARGAHHSDARGQPWQRAGLSPSIMGGRGLASQLGRNRMPRGRCDSIRRPGVGAAGRVGVSNIAAAAVPALQ